MYRPLQPRKNTVRTSLFTVILALSIECSVLPCLAASDVDKDASNPFGIMRDHAMPKSIALAKQLGVQYIRPIDIMLNDWHGKTEDTDAVSNTELKIILTVRNSGRSTPPIRPGSPPTDLHAYQKAVAGVLDAYRPTVLVVEHEENSGLYYMGTVKQYGAQLKAACEVAHAKGVKCTNGGMASSLVASMVWNHYRETGNLARAADFLKRSSTGEQQRFLRSPQGAQHIGEALTRGKALLMEYKNAGMDYVNFHWSIIDAGALGESVQFLQNQTGLQPISNEIGLNTTDGDTISSVMAKVVDLKLPYAIWLSQDRPQVKALQETDGTLRSSGTAFKHFINGHFKTGASQTQ